MINVHEEHVDLQVHTIHSAMDGLIDVRELFIAAAMENWPAVAITDTNTVQAFPEVRKNAERYGMKPIYGAQLLCNDESFEGVCPITILVRHQAGIKNLYTLISISNAQDGRLPLSEVLKHREGLLLGSGGADGLLTAMFLANPDKATAMAKVFDFLEIQLLDYYQYKWKDHFADRQSVETHIHKIAELCKRFDIPLVATSGARYLSQKMTPAYKALRYSVNTRDDDMSSYHYRRTDEMLGEFLFLGEEDARMVVIENPLSIVRQIDNNIVPLPEDSHFIRFDNAEAEIRAAAYEKAVEIYGDPLPIQIEERLSWEMDAIVKSESASMFILCCKITEKAKTQNYAVLHCGCTAASFVAYLLGMTSFNPLPAHYHCACHYCEFPVQQYYTGYDLPEKKCPVCGKPLTRWGMNLVPETLFGVSGEKKPAFQIEVASEYMNMVEQQLTDLFGTDHVFRSHGSRGFETDTAEKLLATYLEKHPLQITEEEHSELIDCLAYVKRDDTLHLAAFFIVPKENEITDFSPIMTIDDQQVTEFDAYKLDTILTKINILDFSQLSLLHTLSDAAGVKSEGISIDPHLLSDMVDSGKPMCLPCFEDACVQKIMKEVKISGISDLLKVYGLAHGTGVWEEQEGCHSLLNQVAFRDDVFNDLSARGIERQKAVEIMELMRSGRFYQGSDAWNYPNRDKKQSETESILKAAGFDEEYINSLKKVQYLYPKAHAAVILDIAMKIIWLNKHDAETNRPLHEYPEY